MLNKQKANISTKTVYNGDMQTTQGNTKMLRIFKSALNMVSSILDEKFDRRDILGKYIKSEQEYALSTKTDPFYFYSGGKFNSPEMDEDPLEAKFVTGKELISMEYHWDFAWDAITKDQWQKLLNKEIYNYAKK